ncbi:unnamed protein product [Psylliodes chrysocephalus]|uniref:Uncharacterized protein n=1 Tax=Psylliodes chrysocephalus TaxID=3402493 RepID=A0A9P0G7A1_9CUCU|nr:unnamed protein product [Psylliodes chrysocephala]
MLIQMSKKVSQALIKPSYRRTLPSTALGVETAATITLTGTRVLNYGTDAQSATTSEDEKSKTKPSGIDTETDNVRVFTGQKPLGSTGAIPKNTKVTPEPLPKRKRTLERPTIEQVNTVNDNMDTDVGEGEFKTPRKFSTNFVKILREKAVRSIQLQNKYKVLTDTEDSDDEAYVTSRKPETQQPSTSKTNTKENSRTTKANNPKTTTIVPRRTAMPPIVIEGKTDDHNSLKNDLKNIIKGKYTIKYTNNSTIIYAEDKKDYTDLLASVKESNISHHTYTNRADNSHAFVLRGLNTGTKIEDIEEDLIQTYDIKTREIYQMSTKYRPLYLIVTDPAITLDFLNKNVRVIENTRITWELRKSTKIIIQCHNCQALVNSALVKVLEPKKQIAN